jgi:predicted acylesterase/phospholipase RssA
VDGGLFCDVPVEQCRALGAEKVVAVIVGGEHKVPDMLTAFDVVRFSLAAMVNRGGSGAVMEVRVPVCGGLLDLRDFGKDLECGFRIGAENAPQILALCK